MYTFLLSFTFKKRVFRWTHIQFYIRIHLSYTHTSSVCCGEEKEKKRQKSYKLQSYFEFKFTFSFFIGRKKAGAENIKINFMFLAYKLHQHTETTQKFFLFIFSTFFSVSPTAEYDYDVVKIESSHRK